MKNDLQGKRGNIILRAGFVLAGIAVNTLLSFLTAGLHLPLYLDTVGTIAVSAVGGALPGIITAALSNALSTFFDRNAVYFGVVNVLIAIYTAHIAKGKKAFGPGRAAIFALTAGSISGGLGALIQWGLIGNMQFAFVSAPADELISARAIFHLCTYIVINILMGMVDKGLSLCAALCVLHFIPEELQNRIRDGGWRQRPLTEGELDAIHSWGRDVGYSIRKRMGFLGSTVSVLLVMIIAGISIRLFYENEKAEKTRIVENAVKLAADLIDPGELGEYLEKGEAAPGYARTERLLYELRNSADGVKYLYVFRIEEDGCRYVFDLDAEGEKGYEPGEKTEFEESLIPYIPALLAGEEIAPIESLDAYGWLLTAFYPVKDGSGSCGSDPP